MLRRFSRLLGLSLTLASASLLHAQDTLLAGFTFSQFIGEGYPAISGETGDPVSRIVATYRGSLEPNWQVVDGLYVVTNGLPGYDNATLGHWSFANFDTSDAFSVRADTFGGVNFLNSTTPDGVNMGLTDQAGMMLTFNAPNTLWSIQVNNTAGYVNADGHDFTFAARGNGGTAIVEWLYNGNVFATSTITSGGFNTYTYELPGGFYETGVIEGRLVSGSVSFDNVQFNGTRGKPPSFTLQPVGQTVTAGANVSFTAAVKGAANPRYRWYKNGSPLSNGGGISGSTTTTLSLTGVSLNSAGTYTVVVSNNGVTAESNPAVLVVQTAPAFIQQPASTPANPGQAVSFIVQVSGSPAPALQWQKDGVDLPEGPDISGVNTAELTLSNITVDSAGAYRVVAVNAVDTSYSNPAQLTVTVDAVAPTIPVPPEPFVVIVGGAATFQVTATGAPAPTYQWRFKDEDLADNDNVSGATTRTLVLTNVSAAQAGDYTVVVTNSAGQDEATTALTVHVPPSIPDGSHPNSRNVVSGASVTFTVAPAGIPAPTYQWKKNEQILPGETSASLTITKARPSHIGDYTVVVTNVAGSIESNIATLNVRTPPRITTQPASQTVPGGASLILSVDAIGSPEPTYQWLKNGKVIPEAIDADYVVTGATGADAGRYSVRVRNNAGTATSEIATVTVTQSVAVTVPTQMQVFAPGSVLSLGQTVAAPGSVTYQWFLNGKPIRGATSPLYVISKAKASHSGTYSITLYNSAGRVIATRTMANIAITVANTYDALLRDPDSEEPVGRLELSITQTGAYTGRLLFEDGGSYPLSGAFDLNRAGNKGTAFEKIKRPKGRKPLELDLTLDALAAEVEVGLSAVKSSDILGVGVAAPRATHVEWQGAYKLLLSPAPSRSGEPFEATATIDATGKLKLSGQTAGGRDFHLTVPTAADGTYAIFLQPRDGKKGHFAGTLKVELSEGVYRATPATSGFFYEFDPAAGIDLRFKPKLVPSP